MSKDYKYLKQTLDRTNAEYVCLDCKRTFYVVSDTLWLYELENLDVKCDYCESNNVCMVKGNSNGQYKER